MKIYRFHNKDLQEMPVNLKNISITGNICGEFVSLTIEQAFENISENNIEAIYSFTIPHTAIITGFEANIGGRTLRTAVESREYASEALKKARLMGKPILKLNADENNVYSINIGSIFKSEIVKMKVSYIDQLYPEDDAYKLTIPRIEYPNEEDGYSISMNILIESFSKLKIWCPSHDIQKEYGSSTLLKVSLKDGETMDRDFSLFLKSEKHEEFYAMAYHFPRHIKDESIVYLKAFPDLDDSDRKPRKYTFIIDSGCNGRKEDFDKVRGSLCLLLRNLYEDDEFNIISFQGDGCIAFKDGFVKSSDDMDDEAIKWLKSIECGSYGKAEDALKKALSSAEDSTIMMFIMSEVKNADGILQYVRENIRCNRIFPISLQNNGSMHFEGCLARISRGKADYIKKEERIGQLILRQFNRITGPQIDVESIDFGGEVRATYPRSITYIYDMEPFSIFAKLHGECRGPIIIKGNIDGRTFERKVPVDSFELKENAYLIEKVWNRKRIESIEESMDAEGKSERQRMAEKAAEISKSSGIISKMTSFMVREYFDEPVLGCVINNILPLEISENAMGTLGYGYFLDIPSFLYKIKEIEPLSYEDRLYEFMAENQHNDGAICRKGDSGKARVICTLKAIIAFCGCSKDISVYYKIINRAASYVIKYMKENDMDRDLQLLYLSAFKKLSQREALIKENKKEFQSSFSHLMMMINARNDGEDVLEVADIIIMKNNM